jgi:hypothetical protein
MTQLTPESGDLVLQSPRHDHGRGLAGCEGSQTSGVGQILLLVHPGGALCHLCSGLAPYDPVKGDLAAMLAPPPT